LRRSLSDDPNDQLLLQIQGAIAEYERAVLGERFRRGKLQKARDGHYITGRPAYGYSYVPRRDAVPGRIIVNEQEAELVRRVYGWFTDEQTTIRQVIKRLNAGPDLPRSGRPAWSASTVHHMLADPIYAGTAYANRYAYVPATKPRSPRGPRNSPGRRCLKPREQWIAIPVPALVDRSTWDRAQVQLARNAALSFRNNTRHSYLLRCLLTCEVCGLAMYGITRPASARKPVRQIYECHGKDCILSARAAACPSRNVHAEEIEPVVWNHVAGLLADPDQLLAQFDRFAAAADAGSAREQAAEQQLRTRLDRTARADKRLLDAYQAGAVSLSELSERRQHLAQERQALEQQQGEQTRLRQQQLQAEAVRTNVAAFCERIRGRLAEATLAEKQAILQLVVERIIVGDGSLEIRHVIPLRSPPQGSNGLMPPKATRLRTDGMNRASLRRHGRPQRRQRPVQSSSPVGDHELRRAQAAGNQVVQHIVPRSLALAAHVLDCQQHLLPIPPHAEHHQQRNVRGFAVQTDPHDRAVQDQADDVLFGQVALVPSIPIRLDLAPCAADHILAHRTAEQGGQRALDPARVGPGQVGACDQRLDLARHPGVARQQCTAPFLGGAAFSGHARPWHVEFYRTEAAQELTIPRPVPVTFRGVVQSQVTR